MARPRTNSSSELSSGQASYVLRRLISERRLSPGEVNRYLGDMHQEIADLERKLDDLKAAAGHPAGRSSSAPASSAAGTPVRRGRPGRPPGRPSKASAAASDASQELPAAGKAGRKRRQQGKELSAEQMASRKLQGRYLALVRQIPATRRGQYSKIAKESGREAAIQRMEEALRK